MHEANGLQVLRFIFSIVKQMGYNLPQIIPITTNKLIGGDSL